MTRAAGIAVLVGVVLGLFVSPASAQFTNYADPPCDQYNQQNCPPPQTPPTQGQAGQQEQSPAPTQGEQPVTTAQSEPDTTTGTGPDEDLGPVEDEDKGPVEVDKAPAEATAPVKADGQLPFTGTDLTVLVIVALLLVTLGAALALVERAQRRRSSL